MPDRFSDSSSRHNRRSPRFRAADEVVLVLGDTRLPVEDVSETGIKVRLPPGVTVKRDARVEFKMLLRDADGVTGWHLHAVCMWVRLGHAGFRFEADGAFSREVYSRLTRLLSAGVARIVNGTEI